MAHWIALTGGIGSGKTTVAELFYTRHQIPCIDTDIISRNLTSCDGGAIELLRNQFGSDFIDVSGSLKRDKMRELILSNNTAKLKLEAILHPLIFDKIIEQQNEIDCLYGFVAIPLLVEQPVFLDLVERVLLVDCSVDMQIERVMKRNLFSRHLVQSIINKQSTREERLNLADDIINNTGNLDDLSMQVDNLHCFYERLF